MVLEHLPIVPDWPTPGVSFLDINGALARPAVFGEIVRWIRDCCHVRQVSSVVAVESRGFVFAAPVAAMLDLPLVLARKSDRLPGPVAGIDYQTEYSHDRLCVQLTAPVGSRPMIIDDVLATGGTITALASLLRENFAVSNVSAATVIGLSFLSGQSQCDQNHIALDVMEWYHG